MIDFYINRANEIGKTNIPDMAGAFQKAAPFQQRLVNLNRKAENGTENLGAAYAELYKEVQALCKALTDD